MSQDAASPVALRPRGGFPPRRVSIFEDPGDERSWHVSQVFESLMRFYDGREPDWYGSAVRPLSGCRRVLELGCGPGLALRYLRAQGVPQVLGIDRWPGFAAVGREYGIPMLMHDLTLPFPFVSSDSVDGVFSHYALDYMSPIGVRQALREANRVLRPDGKLLILLAAIGLAGGDEARTVAYTPEVMRRILADVGFDRDARTETPTGRNTVVEAVGSPQFRGSDAGPVDIWGETQLSAGYGAAASEIQVDLIADGWQTTLRLDFPMRDAAPGVNPLAICVRVVRRAAWVWELQLCGWQAGELSHALAFRLRDVPRRIGLRCQAPMEHHTVWRPEPLALCDLGEPDGSAIAFTSHLGDAQVLDRLVAFDSRTRGSFSVEAIDAAWRAGAIHGVLLDPSSVGTGAPPLLWALVRGAPVLVLGRSWQEAVDAAVAAPVQDSSPFLVLPPIQDGRELDAFLRAVDAAKRSEYVYVVADQALLEQADLTEAELAVVVPEETRHQPKELLPAAENLRYLHERSLLLRLRTISGRTLADIGRQAPLDWKLGDTSAFRRA